MATPNTRMMTRRPTHPGDAARRLSPGLWTYRRRLAEVDGVSCQSVNELLRGRRVLSPELAIRLSRQALGSAVLSPRSRT